MPESARMDNPPFHAFNGVVTLKRAAGDASAVMGEFIPRLQRRGHIEAARLHHEQPAMPNIPRLQRRGHIEAGFFVPLPPPPPPFHAFNGVVTLKRELPRSLIFT